MNTLIQSTEVRQVMTIAQEKHWGFRMLKNEHMISSPVYENGWWFVPETDDESIIPTKAIERVEKLKEMGFKIQGVIVAHEAPKLLCPPKTQPKPKPQPKKVETTEIDLGRVAEIAGSILVAVVTSLFYFLMMAVTIDPAVIIVLEDQSWVEVYRWHEYSG
jgi:hypothetical protein